MSKLIPLRGKYGQGKFAIVDDDMFELLSQYKWYVSNDGYPTRSAFPIGRKRRARMRMHYMILPAKEGFERDHKNHNRLDNRRDNLRYATRMQNAANSKAQINCTSRYKGVTWNKRLEKWQAKIGVDNKTIHIGFYAIEEEAARVRDGAALFYHGEFAVLNFPLVIDNDALNGATHA